MPGDCRLSGSRPEPGFPKVNPRVKPIHGLGRAWILPFAVGLGVWFVCALRSPALAQAARPSTPFLNLRQTALGYHGPDEDLAASGEIRIGWFGPTDDSHPLGADMWCAANLAIEEANAALSASSETLRAGVEPDPDRARESFRLIPRWAANPWGTGISQLARMIYEEQPIAVMGSVDSSATHLAEQIVAKANLPLVSPIATDKSLTLAGVPWMFSCAPSDLAIAQVLVGAILDEIGPKNSQLALLCATDHESRMTSQEVVRELARRQRPPAFRFEIPAGAHNVSRQLTALSNAAPAAVLIIASAEDSAGLLRRVRDLWPESANSAEGCSTPRVFGSQTMARRQFKDLAGAAAEGVYFPIIAEPDPSRSDAARFVEQFTALRKHPPDYTALLTYDATRLLLESIRRAGPNRARVRDALARASWDGIGGVIRFDGTGQNPRSDVQLAAWREGRLERLKPVGRPQQPTHLSLYE